MKKRKKEMDIHKILKEVSDNIEKTANVKTVFGDPIQVGGRTIIPVATVSVSGGGGGGFGREEGAKGKGRGRGLGSGKGPLGIGGGAGLHVESKPVGYIEITAEGAKFVPTPDSTKIAMRGIINGIVAVSMFGLAAIIGAFKKEKKSK
jgi:uncharacterized spore protein YtfJ